MSLEYEPASELLHILDLSSRRRPNKFHQISCFKFPTCALAESCGTHEPVGGAWDPHTASRSDCTTCVPSGVASSITPSHEAKGCMFVDLRNDGNSKTIDPREIGSPRDREARPEAVQRSRLGVRLGVGTGCQSPDVSSHLPRWREVVVFAN